MKKRLSFMLIYDVVMLLLFCYYSIRETKELFSLKKGDDHNEE